MAELSDISDCLASATYQIARDQAAWFELWNLAPDALKLRSDVGLDEGKPLDLGLRNKEGETLLHAAAREGRCAYIRVLAECRADLEATCAKHCTAISVSVKSGHRDAFELLLSLGSKVGSPKPGGMSVMHHAASAGAAWAVQRLMDLGVSEDEVLGPQLKSRHGLKACHMGAGYPDVLRLMRDSEWDLFAKDKNGRTSLHHAATADSPASVLVLLEAGGDLDAMDARGVSARMLCRGRSADLVRSFDAAHSAREVVRQLQLGGICG